MSTTEQLEKVKAGYAALDSYDRLKLKEFIEDFDKKTEWQKSSINEQLNAVRNKSLGPTNSATCLCCGR